MKEAHIGIYMGKEGTAIIEEHSNIVISDGDFRSIIKLLKWGRCVYRNIQKFIQFQLIVSSAALLSNNVGLVVLQKVTLSTIQLLWVGLITDTLACLAFSTEKPTKELIKKPPVHTEDPLVTNIMLRNILPQALFQTIVLFQMPEWNGYDYQVDVTFIFNLYVFCQVFNQINARKLETKNVFEKILANELFLVTAVFIIVLQILFVEILKLITDTTKLNWPQWSLCIGIAFSTLPIGLIVRYIPVPNTQVMNYLLVGRIIERFRLKKLVYLVTWASLVLLPIRRNQNAITDRHGE
ncbi:putative calcium-transporting ATPase 13, plasma membrane-type [Humulus lupulus]|uniref:putative calcium-transporting ATPase 13, plasma membrane-type n=1 Tax=Humulus lupulus TaxID=3486 RepID=UPI002B403FB7|nr:putative calcium-transporting ATPase 13, plasma membrane-type [Humulus lupulus]